jgi:hypothetical protein
VHQCLGTRITSNSLRSFDVNTITTTRIRLIRTIRDGASQPQHPEKETPAFHPLIANKLTCQACSQTHVICFLFESVFEPLNAVYALSVHSCVQIRLEVEDTRTETQLQVLKSTQCGVTEWIFRIGGGSSTTITKTAQPNEPRLL